jgi:molybdopterin-guanine dinucleotide biosynthesis protein A
MAGVLVCAEYNRLHPRLCAVCKALMPVKANSNQKDVLEICILAGGLSSRMGRNKSRLRLGRLTFLGRIKRAASVTGFPVRIIRDDLVPRCGPIGGIYTALSTTTAESLLFVPCDMPFLTSELLVSFVQKLNESHPALFISLNRRVGFPLMIRKKVLLQIKEQIEKQQFSLQQLPSAVGGRIMRAPRAWLPQLQNVNTPEDLERARNEFKASQMRNGRKLVKVHFLH